MAVLAIDTITLAVQRDIQAEYRYYLLQASTKAPPAVPGAHPPAAPWTDTEPSYSGGSTNSLYTVDCAVYSDGTFQYTPVSLSSSYEAAKAAYNRATAAQTLAGSKCAAYYQATAPSGGTYSVNDIWFDTDDGNKMYRWDGSQWAAQPFGTGSIAARAITGELIAGSAITGEHIVGRSITATKIAAGTLTGNELAANTVTAGNIRAGTITATELATGAVTADKLAAGLLTSGNIQLYGEMTVYKDASLAAAGGAIGYMQGNHALVYDGVLESNPGMVLSYKVGGKLKNYLMVTDDGIFLTNTDATMWAQVAFAGGGVTADGVPVTVYGGELILERGSPLRIVDAAETERARLYYDLTRGGFLRLYNAAGSYAELTYDGLAVQSGTLAGGYIHYAKAGHMVTVEISYPAAGAITPTVSAWNDLATLPAGFRPARNVDFAGVNNQAVSDVARAFRVTTSGVIRCWADASGETTTIRPAGCVTYMIG